MKHYIKVKYETKDSYTGDWSRVDSLKEIDAYSDGVAVQKATEEVLESFPEGKVRIVGAEPSTFEDYAFKQQQLETFYNSMMQSGRLD